MKITTEFKNLPNDILQIIYNFLPEQEKWISSLINQFFLSLNSERVKKIFEKATSEIKSILDLNQKFREDFPINENLSEENIRGRMKMMNILAQELEAFGPLFNVYSIFESEEKKLFMEVVKSIQIEPLSKKEWLSAFNYKKKLGNHFLMALSVAALLSTVGVVYGILAQLLDRIQKNEIPPMSIILFVSAAVVFMGGVAELFYTEIRALNTIISIEKEDEKARTRIVDSKNHFFFRSLQEKSDKFLEYPDDSNKKKLFDDSDEVSLDENEFDRLLTV